MATKKIAAKKTVVPTKATAKKVAAPTKKIAAGTKAASAGTKMTKLVLVRFLAENLELSNKQTTELLDLLAQTAVLETKKNGEFTIPGLGKLVKAQRAARLGRNPQTGESIKIKAKTAVKFRVAKAAKDAISPVK